MPIIKPMLTALWLLMKSPTAAPTRFKLNRLPASWSAEDSSGTVDSASDSSAISSVDSVAVISAGGSSNSGSFIELVAISEDWLSELEPPLELPPLEPADLAEDLSADSLAEPLEQPISFICKLIIALMLAIP